MRPHPRDRPVLVAVTHRRQDRDVVVQRQAGAVFQRQVADPVHMGLVVADQCPHVPLPGDLADAVVKTVVERMEAGPVVAIHRLFLLADHVFQLAHLRFGHVGHGRAHRLQFERGADEAGTVHRLHRDRRHHRGALRTDQQEALLRQPVEGIAHRLPADPHLLGDFRLRQLGAGQQVEPDHPIVELGKHQIGHGRHARHVERPELDLFRHSPALPATTAARPQDRTRPWRRAAGRVVRAGFPAFAGRLVLATAARFDNSPPLFREALTQLVD